MPQFIFSDSHNIGSRRLATGAGCPFTRNGGAFTDPDAGAANDNDDDDDDNADDGAPQSIDEQEEEVVEDDNVRLPT